MSSTQIKETVLQDFVELETASTESVKITIDDGLYLQFSTVADHYSCHHHHDCGARLNQLIYSFFQPTLVICFYAKRGGG